MTNKYFILFSDCFPVKGINRSIICDTRNNQYYFIPNGLYEILNNHNGQTIADVKKKFENEYDNIIDEYFDFLISKNLIFFHSNPEFFPEIDLKWDTSSLITNIIIDYDKINHDFNKILKQLEILKCSNVQFRFFKKIKLDDVKRILQILKREKSRIISVDFILKYNSSLYRKDLDNLLINYPRLHSIVLYNATENKSYTSIREKMGYLMYVKKNILSEKHCGIINPEYFYSNIKLFSESQKYNTCLNRKISIDKNGDIKNCPSMLQKFGNIKESSLLDALSHPDFRKYWGITKDDINVCKDCEFRHICTDCRAYIEHPEDNYSKPLKCGYNPYTNEWEEWSTNSLKHKGIKFYDLDECIKINE